MSMKSKELKSYNLPNDNVPISQISAKPTWLFVLVVMMGIISFILRMPIVYGIALIVVGLSCICFMPRVVLMEFYNEYLVMYNRADKSTCVIIYYDEVATWYYSWNAKRDFLIIELEDGSSEKMEAFSKTIFEAHMSRFLKQKRKKTK